MVSSNVVCVSPFSLIRACLLFAVFAIPTAMEAAERRPNVVLVMTDDQGYGDLSCHGNPVIRTPNLDKLYGQSTRLRNFHVSPTCSPTRAALMTGRYSLRTGIWHTTMGRSLMRKDEVTMAQVFAAAGYRTGIFGKWHLGDNYPFRPQDRGFQEVLIHGGGGVGQTPDYWGNDYFDDTYFRNGKSEKFTGYCTDVWFNEAMRFIEANKNRPFFCYVPTNAPHGPYHVADKYSAPYRNKNVPNANFYGMIANIDENMGRLVKRLEALGLEDNTILIFMTDNGTSGGFRKNKGYNAGMRGTKSSPYDGGHRVPCFIRWPAGGMKAGRDVERLTAHIDLLPTLIEMCGLKKPDGVALDGRSLVPLLMGRDTKWPGRTLVVDSQRVTRPQKWRNCAVMTDRWRLIKGKELYDMQADPGQKKNVAEKHPEVVAELRKAYERWWTSVSERFNEDCETIIGSDKENPVCLTSQDWHSGQLPPWNQQHILSAMQSEGFWAIDVARTGSYEISLRRWPAEADRPINAAAPNGKAIQATKARLRIADIDVTQPIPEDGRAVTFKAQLRTGKTRLQGWFIDEDGTSRGAYYAYVRLLPKR